MADIRHTMSLDDSRFAQGLKHAEALAERNVRTMQSGFGRLGSSFDSAFKFAVIDQAFKRSFAIAQNAVKGYASEFTFARAELDRFGGAFHDFNLSLGRDLFNLTSGSGGWVDTVVSTIGQFREWLANKLTDLITLTPGQGDAVDKARKEQEALDKQAQSLAKVRDLKAEISGDLATSQGRTGDAARLGENERHRRRMIEIGGLGLPGGEQLEGLKGLEAQRHEAEMTRIAEREAKEAEADAKQKQAEERRREDARHGLELDAQRLVLQQLRLDGKQKEADLGELQLQMDEKRRAIEQSDALTEDQKQNALDDLWNQQLGLENAMRRSQDRQRNDRGFVGSEISDARVRQQVLGVGAASKPVDAVAKNTKDQLGESKRQTELLKSIDRTLGRQWVGIFG